MRNWRLCACKKKSVPSFFWLFDVYFKLLLGKTLFQISKIHSKGKNISSDLHWISVCDLWLYLSFTYLKLYHIPNKDVIVCQRNCPLEMPISFHCLWSDFRLPGYKCLCRFRHFADKWKCPFYAALPMVISWLQGLSSNLLSSINAGLKTWFSFAFHFSFKKGNNCFEGNLELVYVSTQLHII